MSSWIALIASIVIGGMVLLSFQRFNNDVSEDALTETLDHIAYDNLDEVKRVIEYDFSRIGQGDNDPKTETFSEMAATAVTFKIDTDGNGTLETMRYYLSTTSDANALNTANPNDKVLYRVFNIGTPQIVATGLTAFKVQYFDSEGNVAANFAAIRTLVVSLTMESNYGAGDDYPKLFWQGRITPPSLVMQ
jgi:hypothetical protein